MLHTDSKTRAKANRLDNIIASIRNKKTETETTNIFPNDTLINNFNISANEAATSCSLQQTISAFLKSLNKPQQFTQEQSECLMKMYTEEILPLSGSLTDPHNAILRAAAWQNVASKFNTLFNTEFDVKQLRKKALNERRQLNEVAQPTKDRNQFTHRRAKFTRTQVETLVRLYNENVEPLDGRRQIRGAFQYRRAIKTKVFLKERAIAWQSVVRMFNQLSGTNFTEKQIRKKMKNYRCKMFAKHGRPMKNRSNESNSNNSAEVPTTMVAAELPPPAESPMESIAESSQTDEPEEMSKSPSDIKSDDLTFKSSNSSPPLLKPLKASFTPEQSEFLAALHKQYIEPLKSRTHDAVIERAQQWRFITQFYNATFGTQLTETQVKKKIKNRRAWENSRNNGGLTMVGKVANADKSFESKQKDKSFE